MNKQISLSVVISAFNEEKKIRNCLESVKWADEIIFIDNDSSDRTSEIAKEFTKKIYTQKNDPFNIDLQKNLGIEKASGNWILVLDADEIITSELKNEIIKNINTPPFIKGVRGISSDEFVSGFMIPRKNIIFGKWIQHSGWYPDYQLRLFRNGKGKYEKKHVHEPLRIQGRLEKLNEPLVHYNYEAVSQFLYKHLLIYAPNEAEELLRKGYVFDWKAAIRLPMSEFLSRYFAREGYRDGLHGLVLALLMSAYHLSIFAYIWEKKNFMENIDENINKGLDEELKKSKKEFNYWNNTIKIQEEKNSLKKFTLKIQKKFQ